MKIEDTPNYAGNAMNRLVNEYDLDRLIVKLCYGSDTPLDPDGSFWCGNCNRPDGSNWEWELSSMIYEKETHTVITPCCGVEAAGALISYEEGTV